MAIKKIIKKVKNKVIDVASDVMAAPAMIKAHNKMKQADKDVATLKLARGYDNSQSDNAVMARTAANFVRDRIKKENYEQEYARRRSGKPNRY